jgi:hypothetical protein
MKVNNNNNNNVAPAATNGNTNGGDVSSSNASLHSVESASSKLKSRLDPGTTLSAPTINDVLSSSSPMSSNSSSVDRTNQTTSPTANGNLPAVEESDVEHEECDSMLALNFKHANPPGQFPPTSPKEEFPTIPVPADNVPIPKEELEVEKEPKIECEPLAEIKDENGADEESEKLQVPIDGPTPQPNNSNNNNNLPANNDSSNDSFAKEPSPSSLTHGDEPSFSAAESIISADTATTANNKQAQEEEKLGEHQEGFCTLAELKIPELKEATDLQLNKDGTCELGYKIKKHHHTEVSNVSNTGSRR